MLSKKQPFSQPFPHNPVYVPTAFISLAIILHNYTIDFYREEDDDFEEFKEEDWGDDRKNKAAAEEWANDWDDEDADTDFDKVLRSELEKAQQAQQQQQQTTGGATTATTEK